MIAVLVAEVVITLMDFVEEDLSRKFPASERINHTLLALNYGAILVLLLPVLIDWAGRSSRGPIGLLRATGASLRPYPRPASRFSGCAILPRPKRLARLSELAADGLVGVLSGRQTILVTGATGFIGSRLVASLTDAGHQVIALVRNPAKAEALHPPITLITSLDQLPADMAIDAIVNLAGEPIGNGLWTEAKRRKIVESRVNMTDDVVRLIAPAGAPARRAGQWLGDRVVWPLAGSGADGIGEIPCLLQPRALRGLGEPPRTALRNIGVRVICLRIGLVVGTEGGLLTRMLTPFEFGLGGPMGSGNQWMSWIERDDLIRLIAHAIAKPDISGPINATAPIPVTNGTFTEELGRRLRRPAVFRIPSGLLRGLAGDLANELLLGGQRVIPNKALSSGFVFRHETLRSALGAIL